MMSKPLRGIHVLWAVIAFFALIIVGDVIFITKAVTTFPGEQVKNSYVLGLDFNREIEQRNRQAALGWRAEAGLATDGEERLIVRIKAADDRPVRRLSVSAEIFQPGVAGSGQIVDLIEGPAGEYSAPLPTPTQARIDIVVSATREGDPTKIFEASKTLVTS